MRFAETRLTGAWTVEPEPIHDERGSFSRTFCVNEFAQHRLETNFVQHSVSCSERKGTLRGLHYQEEPYGEVKVVSCIDGAIWDVIVDIRRDSATYLEWVATVLTAENRRQFYIPQGFAHGFQTLTADAAVHYLISQFHTPSAARGLRYDDPAVGVDWPSPPTIISKRDSAWPLLAGTCAL